MGDKTITVNKIVKICEGLLISGKGDLEVNNFSRDTREIKSEDMYLGIKGENTDGNNYIAQAFENGAMGAIIERELTKEECERYKDKTIIQVSNTIEAIQKIAKYKRSLYEIPVIGITGSVGKTSTKDIIANVLSQKFNVLKTEGNYNNHIGLPLTLLKLKPEHTAVVIEMGMNHFGEISLLTDIARPTVCVFTNIGTSHIGNLGSRENILKAKLEMLEGLQEQGAVIINNDNDLLNNWAKEENKYNIHTYGIENKSEYMAYNIEALSEGSKFDININGNGYKVDVPVGGMHFIYNSLCAIAAGNIFNIGMKDIIKGISEFSLTSNRMDIQKIKEDIIVINDSYNASYDSMKAALEVLGKTEANKRVAVLGDMLELGEYTKELHLKVGEEVVKNNIDILITVGDNAVFIAERARELGMKQIYICNSNEEALSILNMNIVKGDAILLKASNSMKFSQILEKLKEF